MKSILQLIQSDISLWDEFYIPSIESFWKNKKVIGKGSTGTVYEIDSKTIMKVQTFFYQGKNRGNEIFLKKSPDNKIIYVKESFLHEALILQEVNSSLLPKIHDCRFGYYQNKLVSILFMERVAGTEYKPWTYQPPQLLQLFKPF
jgi:serine/threonine protein kinase